MTGDRIAEHRGLARDLGVDAVALVPGPNLTRALDCAFMTNERPLLLAIPPEGRPAAVVPDLELASWAAIGLDAEVFDWRDQDGWRAAFAAFAAHLRPRALAVEGQAMRVFVHHALVEAAPGLRVIDAEAAISGLRVIKTAAEIAAIEAAVAVSERALAAVLDRVRVGMTEREVERALVGALFAQGAEGLAFPPIVAAGEGAAMPHARARADRALRAGDPLLIDFGAVVDGVCADITRTVFVARAEGLARDLHETVRAANAAGRAAAARPGATAHGVDDAATSVLEASPFAALIRHKTGHGLGREVHEAPWIMRGADTVLRPGMVFTVEPGLYRIGEAGVRIEDDVAMSGDGARSLTTFTREAMVVGLD